MFSRTKKFIQVWNYLRVSKWWQNFHFWVNFNCVVVCIFHKYIRITYNQEKISAGSFRDEVGVLGFFCTLHTRINHKRWMDGRLWRHWTLPWLSWNHFWIILSVFMGILSDWNMGMTWEHRVCIIAIHLGITTLSNHQTCLPCHYRSSVILDIEGWRQQLALSISKCVWM